MKNSSRNTTRCLISSLSSLHQSCCAGAACICSRCGRSRKMKVLIPKTAVEILDCDECNQFFVVGPNNEQEETPDFLVYFTIPTEEPLFCFVEFKNRPETHAIEQFRKGIKVLQERPNYFSVVPKPQRMDCVIARDRGKGMAHAVQLAVIREARLFYEGNLSKIRFVQWGKKLLPHISNGYYHS